ncbi:hypothetical protein Pmar_PMAR004969 [Perkinsus marinus ATCC 50983]|uniref:Uncharacterized protein n=1 Tax=Perkinsus marinus (strain ATCC 50983 / TXsc) TaxID=423536 RepID=C5KMD9_PERM5|nr:hypothetical protein Pmar_PMAR004969 [Perkinsus marinus ATCC 50983]EER14354.1 hypothetical protein Pmar_PMAR004969 [Perkinsus marinus ATCC 50983]|eukprot:XP_002782559.1 hypothetical protein Pmar_PMAR004969 [Perkinsus marinus ATCC 50983]
MRQARQVEAARLFKEYLRAWDVHRLRLLDNLDASKRCRQPVGDAIVCGDIVRVYRPSAKLTMSWSSRLYKVMEIRAQIARLRPECAKAGQADEVQYVFNLTRATDVDPEEVADKFAEAPLLPRSRVWTPAVPPVPAPKDPQQSADRAARVARRDALRNSTGGGEC